MKGGGSHTMLSGSYSVACHQFFMCLCVIFISEFKQKRPNDYINNTTSCTCSLSQKQFVDTHFVYGTQDPKYAALLCFFPVIDNKGQISDAAHIDDIVSSYWADINGLVQFPLHASTGPFHNHTWSPDSFISVRGVQVKVQCVRFGAIILIF